MLNSKNRVTLKAFFSLAAILFIVTSSTANEFSFTHHTVNDGIPHNQINDIYKDSIGFIWLATRDGVCRYDGYKFEHFYSIQADNTAFPSYSQYIFEDSFGKMWVLGPNMYSYCFDGYKFRVFSKEYILAYPDSNNRLWFVNDSSLISVDAGSLDVAAYDEDNKGGNRLYLISKERNNKKWVFDRFDHQQIKAASNNTLHVYRFKSPISRRVIANNLFIDDDNTIWISTSNDGLIKFDTEKEEFYSYPLTNDNNEGFSNISVYQTCRIDKDHLWVATKNGIDIINTSGGLIKHIRHSNTNANSLCDNLVLSFYKDLSGAVFVGTRQGLNIISKNTFRSFSKKENQNSISSNNVHGFCDDKNSNIWIISSGGLDRFDIKNNTFHDSPISNLVKNSEAASPISIAYDNDNTIWLGTWQGGIVKFNIETNSYSKYNLDYSTKSMIGNNTAMSLLYDSDGELWAGSWGGGIFRFDKKNNKFVEYLRFPGNVLSKNEISDIVEDENKLWIGTLKGLYLISKKNKSVISKFVNSPSGNSLASNQVNSLLLVKDILWIGTEGGLNRLDLQTQQITALTEADGLPSNQIKSILEDNNGHLWVSTNRGLAMIEFNKDRSINHINLFDTSDGLQGSDFLNRSCFKTHTGELLFGGSSGFNIFNPEDISVNTIPLKCVFTNLFIDNNKVSVGDTIFGDEVLSKPLANTNSVTLSYKQKTFSIEFSALQFFKPDKVRYKYMLQGFDEDWIIADSKNRVATYTNIDKGEYTLLVKAANQNMGWSKNPLKLNISIKPPWWKTDLFQIGLYLIVLFLLAAAYRLRIRSLKHAKDKLEDLVHERTHELSEVNAYLEESREEITLQNEELMKHRTNLEGMINERTKELETAKLRAEESDKLKSAFLANMSHEIRTPLNAIVGFSTLFKTLKMSDEEFDRYVDIVIMNSDILLTIVNDIIDLSMIEAGQIKLVKENFNVNTILEEILKVFILKQTNGVDINVIIKPEDYSLTLNNDKIRFQQIMTNLLNNALKFTNEGHVNFGYEIRESDVLFFVEDTGIGISDEDKEMVFRRFHKISPDGKHLYDGAGLGLSICKNLVGLMGGKLWFETEKWKGTKFMFTLPVS